jgi:hypothetical protein
MMPTVMTWGRTRVIIFPNDHRPDHVHVQAPDRQAVFFLRCPDGPPQLRESVGYRRAELNEIEGRLSAELTRLCKEWKKIHGDY